MLFGTLSIKNEIERLIAEQERLRGVAQKSEEQAWLIGVTTKEKLLVADLNMITNIRTKYRDRRDPFSQGIVYLQDLYARISTDQTLTSLQALLKETSSDVFAQIHQDLQGQYDTLEQVSDHEHELIEGIAKEGKASIHSPSIDKFINEASVLSKEPDRISQENPPALVDFRRDLRINNQSFPDISADALSEKLDDLLKIKDAKSDAERNHLTAIKHFMLYNGQASQTIFTYEIDAKAGDSTIVYNGKKVPPVGLCAQYNWYIEGDNIILELELDVKGVAKSFEEAMENPLVQKDPSQQQLVAIDTEKEDIPSMPSLMKYKAKLVMDLKPQSVRLGQRQGLSASMAKALSWLKSSSQEFEQQIGVARPRVTEFSVEVYNDNIEYQPNLEAFDRISFEPTSFVITR